MALWTYFSKIWCCKDAEEVRWENGGIHDSLENVLALELLELPFSSAGDQP